MTDLVPCRSRAVAGVKAVVGQIAIVPELIVEADRTEPLESGQFPRLNISDGGQQPYAIFAGEDGYRLAVNVDIYARNELELALLDGIIRQWLMRDYTLGGLVRDVQFGDDDAPDLMTFDHFNHGLRGNRLPVLVDYATVEGNPFRFVSE